MEKKHYVCIACPRSCRLTVWEEAGEIKVEGATCKRGEKHGQNEYVNPMRMLTTTVAIREGVLRAFGKEMNTALSGRGGGRPEFQQGSVKAAKGAVLTHFGSFLVIL